MVVQCMLFLLILIQIFNFNLSIKEKFDYEVCFHNKTIEDCECGVHYRFNPDLLSYDYTKFHVFCSIADNQVKISAREKYLHIHCNLPEELNIYEEFAKIPNMSWFDYPNAKITNPIRVELTNCVVPLNTSVIALLDVFLMTRCESFKYQANIGSSLEWQFFGGFVNLQHLDLSGSNITSLQDHLFTNITLINSLDLSRNELTSNTLFPVQSDPDIFIEPIGFAFPFLSKLNLSHNKLTTISSFLFSNLLALEELYLDHNYLNHISCEALHTTIKLEYLQLNDNQLDLRDCKDEPIFQNLHSLKSLNLSNNVVTYIQPDWRNKRELSDLDLNFNRISALRSEDLEFESKHVQVNLMNNHIKHVNLAHNKSLVETSTAVSSVKLLLNYNPVNCECNLQDFIDVSKVSRNIMIVADQLFCDSPESMKGQQLLQINFKNFACNLNDSICPENCKCLRRPYDSAILFNCSNSNLTVIPSISEMLKLSSVELHINEHSSKKLPHLPQNISLLDVSHNGIKTLSDNDFNALSELRQQKYIQQIDISNNPWRCDASENFVKFVCQNEDFILNLKNTNCSSNSGNFSVISNEFQSRCLEFRVQSLTGLTALILLVLLIPILFLIILIILYYEYQQEVKIWMYTHKLFRWFMSDDDSDEDKKYDAFISYAHQDEDFAIDTIVAELEKGITNFKTCVHVRDWLAGALITKSINRSVADSRRTIIILSKNYLQSVWGQYEFECAHHKGIVENRIRVVIIIYGDIGNIENLDETLKSYLKTHTYIKWGDPLFWMRLRYALQHWDRP